MCAICRYPKHLETRGEGTCSRVFTLAATARRVVVLLLIIAGSGAACDDDTDSLALRVFEFNCCYQMPTVPGRFDDLMASDGSRHRIAIYWIEPYVLRESTSFLHRCEFTVTPEAVHYWVYGMSQPACLRSSETPGAPLLPREDSVESAVRSALAILGRIEGRCEDANVPLEVGELFRDSRGQAAYTREVLHSGPESNESLNVRVSDVEILNELPYGRQYSKEKRSDGTLVWRARRAMNGQALVSVTIKPLAGVEKNRCEGTFDPATLGRWTLVPEPYRTYWSFDRACSGLSESPDRRAASRQLCDRIESYLDASDVPAQVARGLNRLRFKTALMTDDSNRVHRSAEAAVSGLCGDNSVSHYRCLLELGSMSGRIEKQYPQQAQEWLRPLVAQMVNHAGRDAVSGLDRLMTTISANKWFMYGGLLLDEIRTQHLADQDTLNAIASRLEATRAARTRMPADPCQACASVRRYMAQLDADPPRGEIDMNDLRDILEKGLAKRYTDGQSQAKRKVVDDVIGSIRLIVGEGPFCGDPAALTQSIERFSGLYLEVDKTTEPIDTVLATFLALSFCDISTAQDHDVLTAQFHRVCAAIQVQVNAAVAKRGLSSLVTPMDVESLLREYEEIFAKYVNDPLWPAFKFPLTRNEEIRLASKASLDFVQLEPFLDETGLMVKYGGAGEDLKARIVFHISRRFEQALAEAGFLRWPPYPDVSCQYRGRYGFTAVIAGPLYKEGERPGKKFRAMKYFHLGHRLEHVVRQERELTKPTRQAQLAASQKLEVGDDGSKADGDPGSVPDN
jgi:hypothetical protein